MMKSKEAKEFIDGCMDHLTVEMTDHAKWQLRAAMTRAAELAEQDTEQLMRQKAERHSSPPANTRTVVAGSAGIATLYCVKI